MKSDVISEGQYIQEHRGDDAMLAYFQNYFGRVHLSRLLQDPKRGKMKLENDIKNIINHLSGADLFSVYTLLFNMGGKFKEETLKSELIKMVDGIEFSNLLGMYSYILTLKGGYENTLVLNGPLAREIESNSTKQLKTKESIIFNEKNVIVAFEQGKALGEAAGIDKGEKTGYNKGYNQGFKEGKEIGESTCNKKMMKEEYNKGFEKGKEKGLTTGFLRGEKQGYKQGMKEGRKAGLLKGREEGESKGYTKGYNKGLKDKEKELVEKPVSPDLESAYADGFKNGIVVGEQKSFTEAYNKGYQKALSDSGKPNTTTKQTFDLTEERIREIREQAHKEGFEEGKALRIKELRAMREW